MIKKIAAFTLLSTLSFAALGQSTDTEKKYTRPDIPGTFVLELGLNQPMSAPSNFNKGFWGSRSLNIYYQYDIRILKSRFSLVPGIGVSLERFKFTDNRTLGYDAEDSLKLFTPTEIGLADVKKSQLITNYIEIPVELKYSSKPEDPARSFKASIGGRIGFMYDSFTKLKYKDDGETKRAKDKQNFNLTDLRYGVYGKVGIGNFSLFGYYNLTPLFKEGKGLAEKGIANDFQTLTIGISLSSF